VTFERDYPSLDFAKPRIVSAHWMPSPEESKHHLRHGGLASGRVTGRLLQAVDRADANLNARRA
jgi:hypothetical protein